MITTLLAGAAVAISFSAPPGPVTLETVRRGLRGGFGPALNVQLGSIIGDNLEVEIKPWLAEKLRIGAGSLVFVDNKNGKFTITRSAANDESR